MSARYPTTYSITYVCGHTVQRDLRQFDGNKRANRADWESKHWKCHDCLVAAGQQSRSPESSQVVHDTPPTTSTHTRPSRPVEVVTLAPGTPAPGANEWFQRRTLPPLNGTPRQVESAVRIRSQLLAGAWAILAATGWEENEFLIGVETYAKQVLTAKWWIEHGSIVAHDLSDVLQRAALVEKGEA